MLFLRFGLGVVEDEAGTLALFRVGGLEEGWDRGLEVTCSRDDDTHLPYGPKKYANAHVLCQIMSRH